MTRVLFVCHDASRTGAPLLLFWLVRWLVTHQRLEAHVAILRDGPLRDDFEALCPTATWRPAGPTPWTRRLTAKLTRRPLAIDPDAWLAEQVERVRPDVLYLNTLVLGYALGALSPELLPAVVVSHVHELEPSLVMMSKPELVRRQLALSTLVIACAEPVRDNLLQAHALPPERCVLLPVGLPAAMAQPLETRHDDPQTQRVLAALREVRARGDFLFGFLGQPLSRKGVDLFPLLLRECVEVFGEVPFRGAWIGCGEGSLAHAVLERDLNLLGLADRALVLPGLPRGPAAIACLDVFALLSREDPYPIVVLEAGAQGIPTVCFRGSGGIPELEPRGAVIGVPYLDLRAFAERLFLLARQPEERRRVGERCREVVLAEHTIETLAPKLAEWIAGPG
ncbi:MAG: glycosyltransferase family 4 protein [Cyanobacteriota bacterium]|nr:glycosyltransferase family 4 protein [Cyanobacteriota bacterium]